MSAMNRFEDHKEHKMRLQEIKQQILIIADLVEEQQQKQNIQNSTKIVKASLELDFALEWCSGDDTMEKILKEINDPKVDAAYEFIIPYMNWK